MKKRMFMLVFPIIALSSSAALVAGSTWRVIRDTGCNKCVVTDVSAKCGKCGSSMSGQGIEDSKTHLWEQTYICTNSNCNHTVRAGAK